MLLSSGRTFEVEVDVVERRAYPLLLLLFLVVEALLGAVVERAECRYLVVVCALLDCIAVCDWVLAGHRDG